MIIMIARSSESSHGSVYYVTATGAARDSVVTDGGLRLVASHDSFFKTARTKGEVPSAFCPFAPVESVLVAKVSIGERRGWPGDDDRVVT